MTPRRPRGASRAAAFVARLAAFAALASLRATFAAFFCCVLVPSSRAQVFLPGTQPGDIVNWPLFDNLYCQQCHGFYSLDHLEPWDTWTGSMMANASRDPLFWAAVDIANQDSPGIGEWCIRCHSPKTWLEGRSSAPDGSGFVGFPGSVGGDFEGVDCQFCHRMYEGPTGTPFTQNAQFWVDDAAGPNHPPHRGPYDETKAPHPWLYSEFHVTSAVCAVCHNVKNPRVNMVDETGTDLGLLFPEQSTYDEWTQSAWGRGGVDCQACHMPIQSGYACTDFSATRDLGVHTFQGANAWMTSVLNNLYGESLSRQDAYELSANLALDMLQNQSATLILSAPSRAVSGTEVAVRVRIVNLTGHKLPTGYPEGRRMWIHLMVADSFRQTIFESGRYDFGAAELVEDPALRKYETVHGVHGTGPGFHLALSNRIFSDTRIPPAGFIPNAETAPVGITYELQPDGTLANWDDATYLVPIPAGSPSPVTIQATLYYQTGSREYFEFLRDENVSGPDPHDPDPSAPNRGQKMYDYWLANDRCPPILMKTARREIEIDGPPLTERVLPDSSAARRHDVVAAPHGDPLVPAIVRVGPNPFRDATWIEIAHPIQGVASLVQVFDLSGRIVRTLGVGSERGTKRIVWDGRDELGQRVASGAYFVRYRVEGFAPQVRRLIVMR